jgi:hypothetical protein
VPIYPTLNIWFFWPRRRYAGPSSILGGSMWFLTLPRTKRISGPKNFRCSAKKTFSTLLVQSGRPSQAKHSNYETAMWARAFYLKWRAASATRLVQLCLKNNKF